VPWGRWKRLTVVGALAREGMVACTSIAAATSTAVFQAFVEQVLAPALRGRPDAVVVMDNLAAHKAQAVREALTAANIDHRYLPAYSPDLNPIEPCWSKLKARLRARAARTSMPLRPSSARRSPPSPPKMLEADSASAATMLPTDPNSALMSAIRALHHPLPARFPRRTLGQRAV
jgi:transposase